MKYKIEKKKSKFIIYHVSNRGWKILKKQTVRGYQVVSVNEEYDSIWKVRFRIVWLKLRDSKFAKLVKKLDIRG